MSALITNVEHALATAASDTVKVAKFVETSVLVPVRVWFGAGAAINVTMTAQQRRYFLPALPQSPRAEAVPGVR